MREESRLGGEGCTKSAPFGIITQCARTTFFAQKLGKQDFCWTNEIHVGSITTSILVVSEVDAVDVIFVR